MPEPDTSLHVALTVEQLHQPVPGGSGTYVRALAHELARTPGVRATGIAARHHGPPASGPLPVPVRHSPLPRRLLYDAWQHLRRPVASVPRGSDVVHATTWAVPPRRAPLIVTVHDLAFVRAPEHFTPRGNRFFRRALDIVCREADLVIVPSEATAADCLEAGIGYDRLRTVPMAATPVDVTAAEVDAFRAEHGLRRPYVLWCGTVEPRKNLGTLLRAFAELCGEQPELDLVLVGPPGWGSVPQDVPALPPGRVHVLGRLPDGELHAAYAGAQAFAFPSLWEGFGLPVLEAMSHGVPVVTSAGTSTAEIGPGATLLVDPRDHRALAAALHDAVGSRHDELAQAGLRAASSYSWAATAQQTVAAYRDLSGHAGTAR